MTDRIELQVLRYLYFESKPSEDDDPLGQANESQWKKALAFVDAAGLTLIWLANLKQRGGFKKLASRIQQGLEQRLQDNLARTLAIGQELVEFNRLLQDQNIRYLNLKGQVLYPDFVEQRGHRLQYDHDFLVRKEDLKNAYALFMDLGYSPLPSSPRLAVGHLPTLIKRTGWVWKGNLFDPEIPRAVELHFRLWEPEFDKIPIHSLDTVWRDSTSVPFLSLSLPVLSREHTLLYCVLHAFRHLLRNDLRLSHLYEIGHFLHHQCGNKDFWQKFLPWVVSCPNSCKAVAVIFELARRIFNAQPGALVAQFVSEYLSPAAAMWIERYGMQESIHCYRQSKSGVFLHLDFVEGVCAKCVVTARKLIPRHRPLSSFGVQMPKRGQDRRFRSLKCLHDSSQLIRRTLFHVLTLTKFLAQLPLWSVRLHFQMKKGHRKLCERLSSVRPSSKA